MLCKNGLELRLFICYFVSIIFVGFQAKARKEAWALWNTGHENNQTLQTSKKMKTREGRQNPSDDHNLDICPEIIDFLRKTIDHRKQRLISLFSQNHIQEKSFFNFKFLLIIPSWNLR